MDTSNNANKRPSDDQAAEPTTKTPRRDGQVVHFDRPSAGPVQIISESNATGDVGKLATDAVKVATEQHQAQLSDERRLRQAAEKNSPF
ncbi:hypothetical protein OC835_008078, partial [Tilletia horrida]